MRDDLRADCTQCFGLCCVALRFTASADFAFDKDAGEPCRHLRTDFGCGIHDSLRERGFAGCSVFECFGAGQRVSQQTFGGVDWHRSGETARRMFDVLPVMQQLHELLWYLSLAADLTTSAPIHPDLQAALARTDALAAGTPDALLALDVAAHRAEVNVLLLRASTLARAGLPAADRRGADLVGAVLQGADLRGADLRGAYLIAADLSGADLRLADLIGADLRDTDLRGADLTDALFLTQTQTNAARGDASTRLPPYVDRPPHWPTRRRRR